MALKVISCAALSVAAHMYKAVSKGSLMIVQVASKARQEHAQLLHLASQRGLCLQEK